jgi:hypothetical protein
VRIAHRSRLWLEGGDLQDLALLHAEWALGLGRFEKLRDERLSAGMPGKLQPDDIAGVFLKIALPEPGSILRTSVVRLAEENGGVKVEHLVVRDGGSYRLNPSADAPEIVLRLLADHPNAAPELGGPTPVRIAEEEVARLVAHVCSPQRREPMVLISVDNATRGPIVDGAELARRLAGMCSVYLLDAVRTSHRLREELLDAGFSEKFGCYNGGVRILWPGIVPGDDPYGHTLLLPVRLNGLPERSRTEQVAGTFCEMITEDEDPRAGMREPEQAPATPARPPRAPSPPPSRPAPQARTPTKAPVARVSAPKRAEKVESAPPTSAAIDTPAAAEEPAEAPVELRLVEPEVADAAPQTRPEVAEPTSVEPAPPVHIVEEPRTPDSSQLAMPVVADEPKPPRQRNQWNTLAGDITAALELAEELERDLEATRNELLTAKQALRRAEQQRDELAEGATQLEDVADAVELVKALFPDKLVILNSAHASAIDSVYRDAEKVFRVLVVLAMFGSHDGTFAESLIKALGHAAEWKPKDSPSTIAKFGAQRTWTGFDGSRKLFARHITVGGSVNPQRCLQIYYDVMSDGRVEVAWVGEHRPTVGKDT